MSKERDAALREGLDVIQADMAEHQRITGKAVTAEANRKLASETFQEIERNIIVQPEDQRPNDAPAPRKEKRKAYGKSGRSYVFAKEQDGANTHDPMHLTRAQKREMVRKLKRIHFLLTLEDTGVAGAPSWKQKAMAVMTVHDNPTRFAFELDELLEASNRYFGDWRVDPEKRIIVQTA